MDSRKGRKEGRKEGEEINLTKMGKNYLLKTTKEVNYNYSKK
jgi:hypothetical protein